MAYLTTFVSVPRLVYIVRILCCWTSSIVLSLSKNIVLFISQNTTFRRLDSVSGPEIGTSSIDWAQLSRFYLKTETGCSLRNVVFWKINRTLFLDKDRLMDNVQQHNICTNVPSSKTFRSHLFYVALHDRIIVGKELERMWKETIVS
jgi:hypothetical protein